ncbi:uncharacterized protein LOC135346174 isoform X2 [Halichondria panicea]
MSLTFGQMMSMMSGQMMSQAQGASGFQPRYDAHEQPAKKIMHGTCKCPGCTFPKQREGDKICSRTCAKKFNDLQSSFQQQKVAATKKTLAPALGGSGQRSHGAVLSSGNQATSRSSGSGRQVVVKVLFQNVKKKDIGLIVGEKTYRCPTFTGLLVLGFEYNTKAEHLIMSGEVRVLDVITSLNDKEVSPLTYKEEATKNRSCSLELNRSIALPQLKPLMDNAKYCNPTFLVAVQNPREYQNCSTQKGFGLTVISHLTTTTVSSVTKNSPARFSGLEYEDEIITYGFVKHYVLETGTGMLSNVDLDLAAIVRKTLVLVVKRP